MAIERKEVFDDKEAIKAKATNRVQEQIVPIDNSIVFSRHTEIGRTPKLALAFDSDARHVAVASEFRMFGELGGYGFEEGSAIGGRERPRETV
jgi:hypothetical protein